MPLCKAPKTLGDSGSSPEWQRVVKSLMFGEPSHGAAVQGAEDLRRLRI